MFGAECPGAIIVAENKDTAAGHSEQQDRKHTSDKNTPPSAKQPEDGVYKTHALPVSLCFTRASLHGVQTTVGLETTI